MLWTLGSTARLARWIAWSFVSHAVVLGGGYVARASPPAVIAPSIAPLRADEVEVEATLVAGRLP